MEKLNELIKILRTNGVAVIPTDTIYGLVGSALAPEAAARLRRLKKRSPEKSFIVLIADWSDLVKLGVTADEATQRLAEKLWREEPTSIIFPRKNGETVALRLPHRAPELRELLRQTGPLAAPSANPEGAPPAATIAEGRACFGDEVDYYLDGDAAGWRMTGSPSRLVALEIEQARPNDWRRSVGQVIIKRHGNGKQK